VSFMEQNPEGFASLSDAADAVAAYLPRRPRPSNSTGLRHNLRCDGGRWKWHWDPEVLTQARTLLHDPTMLTDRLTLAARRLRQPCLLVRGAESDVLTAPIACEFTELAEGSTLAEVPHAGHMVAGDNNDAFSAAICTWLEAFAAHSLATPHRPHAATSEMP
jgi:pimeloyl-ACP methyl ester carboxylesterase